MASETPVTLDSLAKQIRSIQKDIRRIRQHIEDPTGEKQAARTLNNGFNKPLVVSPALRQFLGLGADEKISRSQVTTRINAYVTEKGLKTGQNIRMDDTLKTLLNPPDDVQVTFLNIQRYINPHYVKEKNDVPETPVVVKEKKMRPKVVKTASA